MSEAAGDVKGLVEQIAKNLVSEPDQVSVEQLEEEGRTLITLKVSPHDLGRVIGKQGRTARAMRNLLFAAGVKLDRQFALEIVE
jgi:predicted RNA-binding protein YlqC (UPF0109 family)